MAQRDDRKRLGKKHRDSSTRPKKGRAQRVAPTTGAVDPRKRKSIATKRAALHEKRQTSARSPENEARKTVSLDAPRKLSTQKSAPTKLHAGAPPADHILGRQTPHSTNISKDEDWRGVELLAAQMSFEQVATADDSRNLPLIAICGRPNVGKSTLFNRLNGSRRSIVGDEPGITRDRIYAEVEWQNRDARIVDTGGIVPDDLALIPAEIFRQAQVALQEADAIIMVIDGRTELASPDLELARLLLRGGKPTLLAVNKMDTEALQAQAESFRTLGFANVLPISAEHGTGIGDLLDEVFAVLPEPPEEDELRAPEAFLTSQDEMAEDEDGPDFTGPAGVGPKPAQLELASEKQTLDAPLTTDHPRPTPEDRPRKLRSHGSFDQKETKIAIIGRPNVGKSTLLNALTGTDRAIVSPIAGTTRDAVDEVVTRNHHDFRFVDTAGIRRKGKTHLMAEKLSVIMARKHLEIADISLLILDATAGVAALDANIGGYAHESGRSVIIVVNKWDLVATSGSNNPAATNSTSNHLAFGHSAVEPQHVDPKIYEQQIRDKLKYLDYAPLVFVSAASNTGIEALFKKVELVTRERRKRISTGQMNRFLEQVDFQRASVPMNRRVRIYYMTQAAVAPPTFVLFTDKDIKLHFSFERFLANQIREAFGFIGAPIWFKVKARNKKKAED